MYNIFTCICIYKCIEKVSLLAHSNSDVVSDSSVDSINTEAAQQQQLLKG